MSHVAFWCIFLLTPLILWYLLKVTGERFNQISVLNITSLSLYVFSVLGTLPLFYQIDPYRVDDGLSNPNLVFIVLLCSVGAILFFLFGAIFIRKIVGWIPYPITSNKIKPLEKPNLLALLVVLGFVALVLFLYLSKVKQVALLVALRDGADAIAMARSDMGNNFPKYHRYSFVMHDLGTLVTLAFFVLWLNKKSFPLFFLFIISFSMSTFVAVMATEKAPFVNLLIALFMTYYLTRTNGLVPTKHLVIFGISILAVLTIFYIFFMKSGNATNALASVFSRIFAGSIEPAYFYLEYIPAYHDFYWFKTFPNPGHIFPYEPIRYTVEIMNWAFPENVKLGVVGSMPTVFWGEAYLNFGFIGIPIVAFIMGCYVAIASFLISRLQLNAVSIAFLVWMISHLKKLSETGFSGFLYDSYIIAMGGVVLFILSVTTKLNLRKNGEH